MQALLEVILPVFLVLGFGYLATWKGWFSDSWNEGLTKFTQTFAIPCLLFRAIADLDLGQGPTQTAICPPRESGTSRPRPTEWRPSTPLTRTSSQ